jgi:K+-transporting ATPase ATPase C chain
MFGQLRAAVVMLAVMTVVTGIGYPLVVTGIAQAAFRDQANGSLVVQDGKAVASRLIGQPYEDPRYFWSRPSATGPFPYNGGASSGSNQGPTNPALTDAVKGRIEALRVADPDNKGAVPVDLVTAAGSGLDPHISPAAAGYQAGRVATKRGMTRQQVDAMIARHTEGRQLGLLGEPRVNVGELNRALDAAGAAGK